MADQVAPLRVVGEPANDNAEGTITPDDVLMLVVLIGIFTGTLALLAYVMLGGTDDVVTLLRR